MEANNITWGDLFIITIIVIGCLGVLFVGTKIGYTQAEQDCRESFLVQELEIKKWETRANNYTLLVNAMNNNNDSLVGHYTDVIQGIYKPK